MHNSQFQTPPPLPGPPGPRLTAALVALAMLAFAAPASAGTDLWNATVVVRNHEVAGLPQIGYGISFPNSTASPGNTFTAGSTNYTVNTLVNELNTTAVFLYMAPLPSGSAAGNWTLHIGARSIPFSRLSRGGSNWQWADGNLWWNANTLFRDGASLSVRISTNAAPTSSPSTVDGTEDTDYTFAANDFSFSDADTGDTLSSVTVTTLPAKGSLTLSGSAVSANATVTKAQLDSGDLKCAWTDRAARASCGGSQIPSAHAAGRRPNSA